eukprot:scaffold16613_cov101-Isochrysis_galbana.AAC.2
MEPTVSDDSQSTSYRSSLSVFTSSFILPATCSGRQSVQGSIHCSGRAWRALGLGGGLGPTVW